MYLYVPHVYTGIRKCGKLRRSGKVKSSEAVTSELTTYRFRANATRTIATIASARSSKVIFSSFWGSGCTPSFCFWEERFSWYLTLALRDYPIVAGLADLWSRCLKFLFEENFGHNLTSGSVSVIAEPAFGLVHQNLILSLRRCSACSLPRRGQEWRSR